MADIVLAGNTSGTVTLSAPSIAGTSTLNLPASSGTVLDDASVGVCRAWVNFNGTGTVAIRASFNVSSITDNGTGDYTTNFTTALSDDNYSVVASAGQGTSTNFSGSIALNSLTTTACRFGTGFVTTANVNFDNSLVSVSIFR